MDGLQVEPGKPGAEVSKKKNYKSKKEFAYRMCTGWPTTAMPKPFHGCGVLTCFDVVGCRVRSDILWLVRCWWVNVVSCETSCHVMWCDLMCLHFMWCDFLCCVMSHDALGCHAMTLMWCNAHMWERDGKLRIAHAPGRPQRQAWHQNMTKPTRGLPDLPLLHCGWPQRSPVDIKAHDLERSTRSSPRPHISASWGMSSQCQGQHLHPASSAHPGLTTQGCGLMHQITVQVQITVHSIYGCTSKFEVRINPQNPQAIQTPDPDLRSRPIQTSRSRPMIQTYDPDLLLHFVWVCWSRPLVLFWSEHVGSCPIPSLMAGLWPWRTCCPAACCG